MPPVLAALPTIAGAIAVKLGAMTLGAALITLGTSVGASLLMPKPKAPQNSRENADRLRATIDPRTPRKIAIGRTAMEADIR